MVYESAKALMVHSVDACKEWILDFGCSFHMYPNQSWFETLEIEDGGNVLLGTTKHA